MFPARLFRPSRAARKKALLRFALSDGALLLDYSAWILFFCGISTFGVVIFLKVCPCIFLLLVSFEKKHMLAAIPLAAYSLISIVSFCIAVISGGVAF